MPARLPGKVDARRVVRHRQGSSPQRRLTTAVLGVAGMTGLFLVRGSAALSLATTTWSLEVNTFLIVFLAVIPAADVLRTDAQLRISFLADHLPPAARRALHGLTCLLGIGFCTIMVWKSGLMTLQALRYDERMSTTLGTPLAIPYLFLPLGFGVLGLTFLVRLWQPVAPEAAGADPRQQL
jgi:TRAP-type C4-dicarboxylate transport system permease small subunit